MVSIKQIILTKIFVNEQKTVTEAAIGRVIFVLLL